jgi:hypothetical protein
MAKQMCFRKSKVARINRRLRGCPRGEGGLG